MFECCAVSHLVACTCRCKVEFFCHMGAILAKFPLGCKSDAEFMALSIMVATKLSVVSNTKMRQIRNNGFKYFVFKLCIRF